MRIPDRLEPLVEQGLVDEVVRPLMSGKEAQIFLVVARGWPCVAKVYKEAINRSFKHRADYTEGRKTRNSRDQRAMARRTRYGREQEEEAWRSAEADVIYRLWDAGVRVPEPYDFVDGVLLMELVADAEGEPAPRLVDLAFTPREAEELFHHLLREVVKMLCAGIVHGDLSDFNVLIGVDGPVIIDFPQAIDPANNLNARRLLVRDVDNLVRFLGRYAPRLRDSKYGEEMWDLYERGALTPETPLTGRWKPSGPAADVSALLREIAEIEQEGRRRREALGLPTRTARTPVVFEEPAPAPSKGRKRGRGNQGGQRPDPHARPEGEARPGPRLVAEQGAPPPADSTDAAPGRKRRRRRRRGGGGGDGGGVPQPADEHAEIDALLWVEEG